LVSYHAILANLMATPPCLMWTMAVQPTQTG